MGYRYVTVFLRTLIFLYNLFLKEPPQQIKGRQFKIPFSDLEALEGQFDS